MTLLDLHFNAETSKTESIFSHQQSTKLTFSGSDGLSEALTERGGGAKQALHCRLHKEVTQCHRDGRLGEPSRDAAAHAPKCHHLASSPQVR